MVVQQVASGLWRWTAPHPEWRGATDWPEEVGCVFHEAPDAAVLIDPLVAGDEEAELWRRLDQCIERLALPVSILLTAPWHERSAAIAAERYGARVWAHEAGLSRLSLPARWGPLPTGIEVFIPAGLSEGEVAFFLRAHKTLVVAEFLMGCAGGLRVCPSPAMRDRRAFDASLQRLLDLPIERVLVAHGEPVLQDGRRRLAEVLSA